MITHDIVSGSPEWHAYRAEHDNASDAPAMIGCSTHETRSELIQRLATGISKPIDSATQRRFDDGHRYEALARPLAEELMGSTLFPFVVSKGRLSASCDGLTFNRKRAWEHKTLNTVLRTWFDSHDTKDLAEPENFAGNDLPMMYQVQMQQQCDVTGCTIVLFTASTWEGDTLVEIRECWYGHNPELSSRIAAGWVQLHIDVAAYVPTAAAPVVVATAVEALPAVIVTVSGGIQVSNNLALFQTALMDFIENRLILNPSTDQDFADQDVQIKAMLAAEAALDAVEVSMLAQVSEVDSVLKLKQMLVKLVRDNRLKAQKQLAARKEEIKSEIVAGGINALREHVAALNKRIGRLYMPVVTSDFAGAIKNKRTVASLHDAVNTELARAKIDASATADRIQANMATLSDLAGEYGFLFADACEIVRKAPDDLTLLVKARIADHQTAVAAKEEATRLRIRAEEQAKAEREARKKVLAEQAAERAEAQRMSAIQAQGEKVAAEFAEQQNAPVLLSLPDIARCCEKAADQGVVVCTECADTNDGYQSAMAPVRSEAPSANVVPMRAAVAAMPGTPPSLKLGQISERLGFLVTANFLHSLGFEPAALVKNAVLFHEADFGLICAALVNHIQSVQTQQAA